MKLSKDGDPTTSPGPCVIPLPKELLSLYPITIYPLATCCFSSFCCASPHLSKCLGPVGAMSNSFSFMLFPIWSDDMASMWFFWKQSH